jgi:ribosomal protein S26
MAVAPRQLARLLPAEVTPAEVTPGYAASIGYCVSCATYVQLTRYLVTRRQRGARPALERTYLRCVHCATLTPLG